MKYFTDLILGKGFCIFIFFHFPDSSPSVLNGLHFYFSLRDSASRELFGGCLVSPQLLTITHVGIEYMIYILLRKVVLKEAETTRENQFVTFVPKDRSQKYLEKLVGETGVNAL